MIGHVWRAVRLDPTFYEGVEHDESATIPAFLVVLAAGLLSGTGNWLAFPERAFVGTVAASVAGAIVGWAVWSALAAFLGTCCFSGTADTGEMLRVLGFAQAPRALGIIPFLGPVGAVWALVASVVAIRVGLDVDLRHALGTLVVGWLVWMSAPYLATVLLGLFV